MVISHGVVGSVHLSRILDSEPVIERKLLIGVKYYLSREKAGMVGPSDRLKPAMIF